MNKPHGRDLRKGRYSQPNQIYMVTTVTRDRIPVFNNFFAGRILVNTMRFCADRGDVFSHAFVVMPDHLHWLIQLGNNIELSSLVSAVKSYSARKINNDLSTGHASLWQRGFHDHAIRQEENLVQLSRYVIDNPVRAGIVNNVKEYPLWDAVWL